MRRWFLLVEDDPDDVELLKLVLESAGDPQFEVVPTGDAAMRRLEALMPARLPQLVLLDLNLPIVRGAEVLAWMKRHPGLRQIPVAVLTSSDALQDRQCCTEHGCIAYLVKPRDLRGYRGLARVIGRMLEAA